MNALPGGDLVERGIGDLRAGRESIEALLVSVGARRLRAAGLDVPPGPADPELRLYRKLAERESDGAHSAYNALIRRLVSFERAIEQGSAPRPLSQKPG